MSAPFVRFERVEIRSLPGLPAPGLVLDALSPGINVIHGPNASGKSRTAHALMLLLWPQSARGERATLRGRLRLDGDDRWILDVDAGAVSCQRGGADAELPPLPPGETRERYRLELHDLVQGRGEDLASTIALETVGGVDVHRAGAELGFQAGPIASRKEAGALQERLDALRDAREAHARLLDEERRLGPLRLEREQARADRRRADAMALALKRAERARRVRDAEAALAAFPEGMERVAGNEVERATGLRAQLTMLAAERQDAQAVAEQAEEEIGANPLPEGGLPDGVLKELRDNYSKLLRAEHDVEAQRGDLAKARAARNQARGRIGAAVTDEQLAQLDLTGLEDLAGFARRVQEHRASLLAAERQRPWLGEGSEDPQLDAVQQGVDVLRRWLGAQAPPAPELDPVWKVLLTVAGAAAIGAAIAAAAGLGWWLLVLAPLGLIPVVFAWRRPPRPPSAQDVHRQDFADLDLEEPERWDEPKVRLRLARLERRLARAKVEQERQRRWRDVQAEIERLAARQAELEQERAQIAERIGVDPGVDEHSLRWLVTNLIGWEAASTDADVARAELMEANSLRGTSLAALNARLEALELGGVEDAAAAGRQLDTLEDHARRLDGALNRRETSRSLVAALDEQIAERRAELDRLYTDAGLEPGDDAGLADRCDRLAAWRTSRDEVHTARHDLQRVELQLAGHAGFTEALRQRSPEELRDGLDGLADAAEREQRAHDEIVRIEHGVLQAKRSLGVEAALAAVGDARAALAERRERDRLAAAGDVLADWLYQRSRDRDRPAVFHRARELLRDITRGRYRLDIEDGRPPRFRAYDAVRERGLELDQLSSGTRAQLLLAVRVAFVETQELGARPPLILDETLANSDDARARAIIEAALELARAGRQLFYFTAQHDEVDKWRTLLAQAGDVEHRLIDLQQVRQLTGIEAVAELPRAPREEPAVVAPDGLDHEAYGRALGVPPIDPRAPLGAVHLWHLVEDPAVLSRLLGAGVQRWGPLQQLLASGGGALLGDDPAVARRVEAAARALEALCREWRVGRGRPVDRQALVDTGAVTPRPLPHVAAIAEELGGDPRALLARLETEKIPGLGPKGLQRLRERLEQHGYLDPEEPLDDATIRARALGTVAADVAAGVLDPGFVDRALRHVAAAGAT